MKTKFRALIAATAFTVAVAPMAVAGAQQGVPLKYNERLGDSFQGIQSNDLSITAKGNGGFYRKGRVRVMIMSFDSELEHQNAIDIMHHQGVDTGFRWVNCDNYVVTMAAQWIGGPDSLTIFEANHLNKWMKRYAKRHDNCTVQRYR